jgi:hypothetical protein
MLTLFNNSIDGGDCETGNVRYGKGDVVQYELEMVYGIAQNIQLIIVQQMLSSMKHDLHSSTVQQVLSSIKHDLHSSTITCCTVLE